MGGEKDKMLKIYEVLNHVIARLRLRRRSNLQSVRHWLLFRRLLRHLTVVGFLVMTECFYCFPSERNCISFGNNTRNFVLLM